MVVVKHGKPEDGDMQYTSFPQTIAVAPYPADKPVAEAEWYADSYAASEAHPKLADARRDVYVGMYQLVGVRKLTCEVHDSPAE